MIKSSQPSDNELFCKYRSNDCGESFATLFNRYESLPRYIAKQYGVPTEVANDIAQEAWLRAVQHKETFDESRPFKSWILRIVQNKALTARENYKKHRDRFAELDDDFEPIDHRAADPSRPVIAAEARLQLEAAADEMSPKVAAAFRLLMTGEHTMTLAAEEAGCHLNQLSRAIAAIKTCEKPFQLQVPT